MRYMAGMMMIALLALIGQTGVAGTQAEDFSKVISENQQADSDTGVGALCEAERNRGIIETAALGDLAHKCKAVDNCGREYHATGICYDHAYDAALRKCKNETRDDPYSCRISSCWKVCD